MRHIEISATQKLVNKINAKQDFTVNLNDNDKRYIVSSKELYKGTNPSIEAGLITKVNKSLNSKEGFDSLGGWLDKDTGTYYLALNDHYHDLEVALSVAEATNQLAIYDNVEERVINVSDYQQVKG